MNTLINYPLVSVVMCTYNGEKFLEEQLDSIVSQTYPNIEVIVIDDCSTDNTYLILKRYKELYKNVEIYLNDQNIGYVKNFEKGMKLARGKYIAPSDQDDIWDKEKISVLAGEIKDHEIIYCNSLLIDESGNSLNKKLSEIKKLLSFNDCLNYTIGNTAAGHAMLIAKELIERCLPFPDMIPHDYWLGFVATFKQPIRFLDLPMIKYRQHNNNVFGISVSGNKRIKKELAKEEKFAKIRERMHMQYLKCPDELVSQKRVFLILDKSYASFSLKNNFDRMMIFFYNRQKILAFKKKSGFRKWLFCFKMFFKIK